ncbi:MAG: flagellar protein [Peptococcaceae bacterium]|nr:flagellar protein [Peptococcaceae bacterium]
MDRDIKSILPVGPLPGTAPKGKSASLKVNDFTFEKTLEKELAKSQALKFSAHAEKRLKERNIVLAREDLAKIDKAVRQAEAKGARESLIIYGDLALITSVRNKTVVTAMDGKSSDDHVFTNIDSAVIVK